MNALCEMTDVERFLLAAKTLDAESNDPSKSEYAIIAVEASDLPMAALSLHDYLTIKIMLCALLVSKVPILELTNNYLTQTEMNPKVMAETLSRLDLLLEKQVYGTKWAANAKC